MANMSNYLEGKLIDHIFRGTEYDMPSVLAVALCTTSPNEASTGATIAEVANSRGYSRVVLNPSEENWSEISNGRTTNQQNITFSPATGSWGTVTSLAICDSATWGAGNVLFYADLDTPQIINANKIFSFTAGNLSVQIDN
jgi:hypothetical protein